MKGSDLVGPPSEDDREQEIEERADEYRIDCEARKRAEEGTGRVRIKTGSKMKMKPVEWVWHKRLPLGTVSLIAGKGASGKSTFAAWLAAEVTKGELEGCWKGTPKGVLWATLEASHEREVLPRAVAAGADDDLFHFVDIPQDDDPANTDIKIFDPAYIEDLRDYVEDLNVGLIVLDPMLDVLSANLKSGDQKAVRAALARISSFAEERDVLVLGIAHFNKMNSVAEAIDRVTDSAAFTQRPRAAIAFAYDDESDCHVVSQIKNNWGTLKLPSLAFEVVPVELKEDGEIIETVHLKWKGESEWIVDDILSKAHKKDAASKTDRVAGVMRYTLRDHSLPKAEVMTAIEAAVGKVGDSTLQKAKALAGVISERAKEEHGPAMWSLLPDPDC